MSVRLTDRPTLTCAIIIAIVYESRWTIAARDTTVRVGTFSSEVTPAVVDQTNV